MGWQKRRTFDGAFDVIGTYLSPYNPGEMVDSTLEWKYIFQYPFQMVLPLDPTGALLEGVFIPGSCGPMIRGFLFWPCRLSAYGKTADAFWLKQIACQLILS